MKHLINEHRNWSTKPLSHVRTDPGARILPPTLVDSGWKLLCRKLLVAQWWPNLGLDREARQGVTLVRHRVTTVWGGHFVVQSRSRGVPLDSIRAISTVSINGLNVNRSQQASRKFDITGSTHITADSDWIASFEHHAQALRASVWSEVLDLVWIVSHAGYDLRLERYCPMTCDAKSI